MELFGSLLAANAEKGLGLTCASVSNERTRVNVAGVNSHNHHQHRRHHHHQRHDHHHHQHRIIIKIRHSVADIDDVTNALWDCNDGDRTEDAQEELSKILYEDEMRTCPKR